MLTGTGSETCQISVGSIDEPEFLALAGLDESPICFAFLATRHSDKKTTMRIVCFENAFLSNFIPVILSKEKQIIARYKSSPRSSSCWAAGETKRQIKTSDLGKKMR